MAVEARAPRGPPAAAAAVAGRREASHPSARPRGLGRSARQHRATSGARGAGRRSTSTRTVRRARALKPSASTQSTRWPPKGRRRVSPCRRRRRTSRRRRRRDSEQARRESRHGRVVFDFEGWRGGKVFLLYYSHFSYCQSQKVGPFWVRCTRITVEYIQYGRGLPY